MTHVDSHAWAPAPRPGLVPLHPLGFGTVMGKAFAVLRGNAKTLLGFAIGMQMIAAVVTSILLGILVAFIVTRLATVSPTSADFGAILAGSIALYVLSIVVVTIVVGATSVLAQAATVAEVRHASLAEKASLKVLWPHIRRAFWPMIGFAVLFGIAFSIAATIIMAPMFLIMLGTMNSAPDAGAVGAAIYMIFAYLGIFVLSAWASTKTYLVPSVIVFEKVGPIRAFARSWKLTRGRFWFTFGVWILLAAIASAITYVALMAFYLVGAIGIAIFVPTAVTTGDPTAGIVGGVIFAVVAAAIIFLLQALFIVVTSAGGALTYLDARMRAEGIDVRMQRYVEARQQGRQPDEDPFSFVEGAAPSPYVPFNPYAQEQYASQAAPGAPFDFSAPPQPPQQSPYGATPQAAPGAYPAQPQQPAHQAPPAPQPPYAQPQPPAPQPPYAAPPQGYAAPQQPSPQTPQGSPVPQQPAPSQPEQPQPEQPQPPEQPVQHRFPWSDGPAQQPATDPRDQPPAPPA